MIVNGDISPKPCWSASGAFLNLHNQKGKCYYRYDIKQKQQWITAMDGPKIDENYREKFEKLAKRNGEIIAIVSNNHGEKYGLGEKYLLKDYLKAEAIQASLPDDLKEEILDGMAVSQKARADIQDYKIRHNIPLDTPPVSETPPPRSSNAANDENYSADILRPEF